MRAFNIHRELGLRERLDLFFERFIGGDLTVVRLREVCLVLLIGRFDVKICNGRE